MRFSIELTEKEVRAIIVAHLAERLGPTFKPELLRIETKSSRNYKAEWEIADFRVRYEGDAG